MEVIYVEETIRQKVDGVIESAELGGLEIKEIRLSSEEFVEFSEEILGIESQNPLIWDMVASLEYGGVDIIHVSDSPKYSECTEQRDEVEEVEKLINNMVNFIHPYLWDTPQESSQTSDLIGDQLNK